MADWKLAQSSVLGSMLIDARCIGDVMTALRPEDFTEAIGRTIFEAIRRLYLSDGKVDPVTVLHEMGEADKPAREYLLKLMDVTPTAANVGEYIRIVREESRLRKLQGLAAELISTGTTMARAGELVAQMQSMMTKGRSVECMSMEEGIMGFYADMDRTPEYLPWGLDMLDDPTEGLTAEAGDYIVIGGYPSDGKTALALSMAYEQAKRLRVGFFSLETKNSKLFNRIFGRAAQVSGQRIKRRKLDTADWDKLAGAADSVRLRKLDLIRASSMSVEDIGAFAMAKQYDVIYIDYLTLIAAPGRTEFDQATCISKALHRLAQDNNLTVVALSQLSRPETGKVKAPTLASLRSSGQIEQDADVVMLLYREEPGQLRSRRVLSIAKNKEGPTGQLVLRFDGETQSFTPELYREIRRATPRREPDCKQAAFYELPGSEPLPWEETYPAALRQGEGVH